MLLSPDIRRSTMDFHEVKQSLRHVLRIAKVLKKCNICNHVVCIEQIIHIGVFFIGIYLHICKFAWKLNE